MSQKTYFYLFKTAGVTVILILAMIPQPLLVGQPIPAEHLVQGETDQNPVINNSRIDFIPPGKGRPQDSWGGGTHFRDSQREIGCPSDQLQLLIPLIDSETAQQGARGGLTIASHPTFFVYVPAPLPSDSDVVPSENATVILEFVLSTDNEDIYSQELSIANTPGILRLELPPEAPALEIGQEYDWSLTFYCQPPESNPSANPDTLLPVPPTLFSQGSIKRVQLTPEEEATLATADSWEKVMFYAQHSIWNELLVELVKLRQENPNSVELEQAWKQLLESETVNLDGISNRPLLD